MKFIDQAIIKTTSAAADASPRKRAHHLLHESTDRLQRMLQVANKGSYYTPHFHDEKLEAFIVLEGEAAAVIFDDKGELKEVTLLGKDAVMAEIPPGAWHSFVVLSEKVTFIELLDGYYDPNTHKNFAPWAPQEDDPEAKAYEENLVKRALAFAGQSK